MKERRKVRSPTFELKIDDSKGYDQLCAVFADTEVKSTVIMVSKQDFMAMKPYIGEQLTLAL